MYQNSNSGNPHQNEWNIKITAQTLHEGINNTANKKEDMDGQTWRRWKRIAIGVFENRFSKLENSQMQKKQKAVTKEDKKLINKLN